MWEMFETAIANTGLSFETTVLLIVTVGSLIFYAKDFKIGVVMSFLAYSMVFAWFYAMGNNYRNAIFLALLFFIVMCFTLYASSKVNQSGQMV